MGRRRKASTCLTVVAVANSSGGAVSRAVADNHGMTLALLIPTVGVVILLIYFAVEASSDDPWDRKKSD
jgi:hypothetical protein